MLDKPLGLRRILVPKLVAFARYIIPKINSPW